MNSKQAKCVHVCPTLWIQKLCKQGKKQPGIGVIIKQAIENFSGMAMGTNLFNWKKKLKSKIIVEGNKKKFRL